MKCFVLSLHRSGTSSASILLERLGIRTVHWPGRHGKVSLTEKIAGRETNLEFVLDAIIPALSGHEAAADVPIPVLYRQLQRRFPEAKWILLLRRPEDWVRSIRGRIGERELRPFERVQYWHYFPERPARLSDLSDAELVAMYGRHTEEVVDYSNSLGAGKLGVFDLHDPSSGSAVASFLGHEGRHEMPNVRDPLKIRAASRRARLAVAFKRALRSLGGNS
jgi:hypothetical protein